jgi:hypothetical protein
MIENIMHHHFDKMFFNYTNELKWSCSHVLKKVPHPHRRLDPGPPLRAPQ